MRILTAGLAVTAAALLGLAAFAVLNLRALVGAHQGRLVARIERAIGRPFAVGDVSPSWWPLGIRLHAVTVGEDPAFGTEPFLDAEGVVMGVRAWPLVRGRIEAAGITLETPHLNLVRAEGGRWNVASLGGPTARKDGRGKSKERRLALRVPIEWMVGVALARVRDGTITITDRSRGAAAPVVLRHVSVRATDVRVGAAAHVGVEAALFRASEPDVRLELRTAALGEHDLAHAPFTARLTLDGVDMAELSDRLGRPRFASGRVQQVTIDVEGTLDRPHATFAVEATDPTLRIGALPLGALQPIAVQARLSRAGESLTIEDLRATVGTLVVRGRGAGELDPWRLSLDLRSDPAGAAGLDLGLRTIALRALEGRVAFGRAGVAFAPLSLHVDDVPVSLRGEMTGVDPPVMAMQVEAQPFGGTLAAGLAIDASGAARAQIEAAAIALGPATTRLVPEVAGRVEGRGSGTAVLTGRIVDGAIAVGSLTGGGTLGIVDGRLRDVNLPDRVVQSVEALPFMPTLVSASTRERYSALFASRDTVIESATLPFTIARRRLTVEHGVLVNPAYQVAGDGWLDEARALRFRGTVLLGSAVSRTLREDVRAAKYLATDDGRIALPFVARGQLDAVRVEPDVKRLRARSLEALLGPERDGAAAPDAGAARRERRRDGGFERQVIERLEKLLRP
ncbi:MAG: hypothetical protein B6D46_01300 [Polyangiaceae bacterium UTPRO1]|jgi:hypothetical protein|nr:AsmA family protein [Myxococcales bacterium]OQY69156.1 MAG: hypothetical protein B6D46_01300 [Polyangiaceae bacterium UTPRO1]